ncbi:MULTISPECIES: hypothetical protein [unclassified Streptomyces]|uniref:hypothetical protein n=1 Tax=unclassified Streptomyces TaxID=2593676 RepID=UPI0006AE483E|nr:MULTISPECIES: hypothetical protein [unclassified Streptomyces]KOX35709.1 membrane protein [Streptomyces sp. NRRL F-6491]KOX50986.1 membrane protein [Streptomyces sp. NRRL F-6492]
MRSGPIALRAAGAALLLVLAPAAGGAHAHDGVRVTVTPSTASPGDDVDVRVEGCKGTTGAARSRAFTADAELTGRDGGKYPRYGDAVLRSGLDSGTYPVSVTCDGHEHRDAGTVRVERHEPTHRPTHEPTHHATPVAPVRAGGGGAAAFAAPAAPGVAQAVGENGLGTPYTVLGLGMAAVAAVAVAFRSSRRRTDGSSVTSGRTGTGTGPE